MPEHPIVQADRSVRSLAELEGVIERGIATFVDVGLALSEIRDRRLYRLQGHTDFDAYCRERWRFGRRRADQMIAAASVTEEVGTIVPTVPLPANEAQARELARVGPERRAEVWQAAIERHGPAVTAAAIREVATPTPEPPALDSTPTAKPTPSPSRPIDLGFEHAKALARQMPAEVKQAWADDAKRTEGPMIVSQALSACIISLTQALRSLREVEPIRAELRRSGVADDPDLAEQIETILTFASQIADLADPFAKPLRRVR